MKALVIGKGGREHAIVRALATADTWDTLYAMPGNPGMKQQATCLPGSPDVETVRSAVNEHGIDLVVVGPEQPLVDGLADALAGHQILVCGPNRGAARLEASKAFTRELAQQAGVPSPQFRVVTSLEELPAALADFGSLPVVKADGLAAGKGVYLPDTAEGCRTAAEQLLRGSLGEAGKTVVLEERLTGVEASLFFGCSGTEYVRLPHAQDFKRLNNGDAGPNTGGMGAVSPNPHIDEELQAEVEGTIIAPTLEALENRGTPFHGFLYAGLMLTSSGPKLLEFNVRLGDPETQAVLPRLQDGSFSALCLAIAKRERLSPPAMRSVSTCAVVTAATGYPDAPRKGDQIDVSEASFGTDRYLIHAGTARNADGDLVVDGGRVAAVVASADSVSSAIRSAYQGVEGIQFKDMHYRTDIGGSPQ